MEYLPSVHLINDRCIGCTDCIKRCPTEAIRVRNGKAVINNERCIDCGVCIRVCRSHAKQGTTDSLESILNQEKKIKVVIPAPTLYTQFKEVADINVILTALKQLGFDDVFEVSKAAELVTRETVKYLNQSDLKPIISSACPAILRLIQIRFPSLIKHVLPMLSPMELAAKIVKEKLHNQYKPEEVGVYFITPCAAKMTNIRMPQVLNKSYVDGAVALRDIYSLLLGQIKKVKKQGTKEILHHSSLLGINWARSGGESDALDSDNVISVDGIHHVIDIFESVENDSLTDVDYIEALACDGGCLGGPLTVENCFVAKNRMHHILKKAEEECPLRQVDFDDDLDYFWEGQLNPQTVMRLDDNIDVALEKMERIENLLVTLPGIDCGSCGAPTCRALAEDIVMNKAVLEDCIFMLRQKVKDMAEEMSNLSGRLHSIDQDKMGKKESI